MAADDLRWTVHLWTIRCATSGWDGPCLQWLSPEEHRRAAGFRLSDHRAHFLAAHTGLRGILAGYLGCSPRQIVFGTNSLGKPMLAGPECGLRFNLSHSGDLAVVGISRRRELGVDVEYVPSSELIDDTKRSVFTERELTSLAVLGDGAASAQEFARLWTRKEAYLKALGAGLTVRLTEVDVSVPGNLPWVLDPARSDWHPSARWTLQSILVAHRHPGAVASVAAEGSGWRLRRYTWPDDADVRGSTATR